MLLEDSDDLSFLSEVDFFDELELDWDDEEEDDEEEEPEEVEDEDDDDGDDDEEELEERDECEEAPF